MSKLIIYADGSSRGNPGPGGYGAILKWGESIKELSQGYKMTTNNRMELMGVIAAMEQLKRTNLEIDIFTDSEYIVNSIEKRWVFNWEKKGYAGKKNADLWKRLLRLYRQHQVRVHWVKGHANNPWNNRCDQLATEAADSGKWLTDEGFGEIGSAKTNLL
jgi:ribonuclease HI